MTERSIKIPGPDHPIAIKRNAGRVLVRLNGRVVADGRDVLTLREAADPPVHYIAAPGRGHGGADPLRDHDLLPLQGRGLRH